MDVLPPHWADFLGELLGYLPALPAMPMAVWMGLALLMAVWLGEQLQRWGMARTTGYWLCGVGFGIALACTQAIVGHSVRVGTAANAQAVALALGKPAPSAWVTLQSLSWIFDLALGWVLLELGQRMNLRWLLRNKALATTAVLEYAVTWMVALWALRSLGLAWLPAGVGATMAAHSSPVMLSTLLPQWHAEGQVTERALHVGSINTVLTAMTLPVVLSLVGAYAQGAATSPVGILASGSVLRSGLELAQPLWDAAGSVAIGYALGWLLSCQHPAEKARRLQASTPLVPSIAPWAPDRAQWLGMLGAVCVAVGLAQWLSASAMVACLALGLSMRKRAVLSSVGHLTSAGVGLSQLAQVMLFLVAGASLPWLQWLGLQPEQASSALDGQVLVLAALLLATRLCAKVLVCTLTARWAGLRWVQGMALGLMLQPLSMSGLVFWAMAASALAGSHTALSHAALLMLCVSDVLAPWLMRKVLCSVREVLPEYLPPPTYKQDRFGNSGLNTQSSLYSQQIDTHTDVHAFRVAA